MASTHLTTAWKRAMLGMAFLAVSVSALNATGTDTHPDPEPDPDPRGWTRETAATALSQVDTSMNVQAMTALTLEGADTELLELLDATRLRDDWPAPARDAAIFAYAQGLADLPADAVPATAMRYLSSYTPLTQVPHDDHAHGVVPLLNVRAVTRGVENGWLRQEARAEAFALMRARPASLVDAWLIERHTAVRSGYLEALEQSTPTQIASVSRAASQRLADNPALTDLAGRAALLADDEAALGIVLRQGHGPALQHLMQAMPTVDAGRTQRLFEAALDSPNPDSAALAIALLYPALAGNHAADAALLTRLGDPTLGASAALALATSPAPDTQLALEGLATTANQSAAKRAQLALDLRSEINAEDR